MMIKGIELDTFAQAYIECAFWAEGLGESHDWRDLPEEALLRIVQDCQWFKSENWDAIRGLLVENIPCRSAAAAHDFYLTRNGHGSGFWDREDIWGEDAERLSGAAREFGEFDLESFLPTDETD